MVDTTLDCLRDAIARNAPAVLSLPSAGMLRHYKTRLLAEGEGGFWIESVANEADLLDELTLSQVPVGVAFKSGESKVVFATPLWRREPLFRVNAELHTEALLLALPSTLKTVQRRTCYRVRIPMNADIGLQVWRIPEHVVLRDKPLASQLLVAQIRDLSTSGVGFLCPPRDGKPLPIALDQRLRIVIRHGETEALLEGCVRYAKATPDKSLRLGVQFKKLENDIEGRQTLSKLTHIVGQLQREEIRRMRLGLAG